MLYLLIAACAVGLVGAEIFNRFILENVEQGVDKPATTWYNGDMMNNKERLLQELREKTKHRTFTSMAQRRRWLALQGKTSKKLKKPLDNADNNSIIEVQE